MKILFLSPHESRGGASKICNLLASHCRAGGHTVQHLVKRKHEDGSHAREACDYAQKLELVFAKPLKKIDRALGREHFFFPWTTRAISDFNPDIIHIHNPQGGYFDLRSLRTLSAHTPIVMTLHDPWLVSGHCSYFIDCSKWQSGCGACPDLQRRPSLKRDGTHGNWIRKQSILRNSRLHIASPSQWLLDIAKSSIISEGAQDYTLIRNGVDTGTFTPIEESETEGENLTADVFTASYVVNSNLITNPYKDFSTIKDMAIFLSKLLNGTNKRVRLLAAGADGPKQILDNVSIEFMGYIRSERELATLYATSDVYLHAANADNYPNTILEAMSCGTPCIATETGGLGEQISHGTKGLLVGRNKPREMAMAVISLMKNRSLLREMSMNARKKIENENTLSKMCNSYVTLYEEVISSHQEKPGDV